MILIVQHGVRDDDAWKAVFDEHEGVRRRHGATGHTVHRSADDPNGVIVVNHFPLARAGRSLCERPVARRGDGARRSHACLSGDDAVDRRH
jgi:hypothetical protein